MSNLRRKHHINTLTIMGFALSTESLAYQLHDIMRRSDRPDITIPYIASVPCEHLTEMKVFLNTYCDVNNEEPNLLPNLAESKYTNEQAKEVHDKIVQGIKAYNDYDPDEDPDSYYTCPRPEWEKIFINLIKLPQARNAVLWGIEVRETVWEETEEEFAKRCEAYEKAKAEAPPKKPKKKKDDYVVVLDDPW